MDKALINKLVKYKINLANKLVEYLPSKAAEEVKNLGRSLIESAYESASEPQEQPAKKSNPSHKSNNIPIT